MSVRVEVFTFNPFQENTYLLIDDDRNCVIIDPGCCTQYEKDDLLAFIQKENLNPLALLNTHGHLDHVMGNAFIQRQFNLDFYLHEFDLPTMRWATQAAVVYGVSGFEPSPEPTKILQGGEKLIFGGIALDVLFTPGHAPGHVVFYNRENNFVINGDVLFRGSYGRYDLPGGNLETLKKTIMEVMFMLPEDTVVYTGHGEPTTIGREKRVNPILNF